MSMHQSAEVGGYVNSLIAAFSLGLACVSHQDLAVASEPIGTAPGNQAAESGASPSTEGQTRPYWKSIPPGQGYISVAHTEQSGGLSDDFDGIKLSYGAWLEDPYRSGFHFLD